ncbi:MAG: chemotaxis protein CheD [Thermovirga sp.]
MNPVNSLPKVQEYSHNVGMGDTLITHVPGLLSSLGLGSCLALVLYDVSAEIAGMVHIMLPRTFQSTRNNSVDKPGKFADRAIRNLVEEMQKQGASKARLKAKLAGGAKMFSISSASHLLSIGEQNISVVLEELELLMIPLEGQETGGTRGRSVTFFTESWQMEVRTIGQGTTRI